MPRPQGKALVVGEVFFLSTHSPKDGMPESGTGVGEENGMGMPKGPCLAEDGLIRDLISSVEERIPAGNTEKELQLPEPPFLYL